MKRIVLLTIAAIIILFYCGYQILSGPQSYAVDYNKAPIEDSEFALEAKKILVKEPAKLKRVYKYKVYYYRFLDVEKYLKDQVFKKDAVLNLTSGADAEPVYVVYTNEDPELNVYLKNVHLK